MRFPTCFNPELRGKRGRFYLIRDLTDRVQLLTSSFVTLGNRTVFRIQSFETPFREHPQVPYKNSYSHPTRLSSGEAVYSTHRHLRLCPKQLTSTQHPNPPPDQHFCSHRPQSTLPSFSISEPQHQNYCPS